MSGSTEIHRRRAGGVVAFAVIVLAAVGLVLGAVLSAPVVGLLVGIAVAGLAIAVAWRSGPAAILRWSRARPVDEREQARLHNLVDGMSATVGIRPPTVHVIDDPAPNALVVGRGPRESSIAVTTGLLMAADRIQLEAVVAVLLGRIRSHEVGASTLAATVLGGPVIAAELMVRTRWWNGGRVPRAGDRPPGDGVLGAIGPTLATAASVFAPALRRAAPAERIVDADQDGCALTRYPPGLATALATLAAESTVTHAALSGTAHLWFASPLGGVDDDGRFGTLHRRFTTHPSLDERITRVREL